MSLATEARFFDRFAEARGDYDVLGEAAYRRLIDLLGAECRPWASSRVIDLGCGSGAFTRRIRRAFGCDTVGLDISRRLIERAKLKATFEKYYCGDIRLTGFRPESFDAVAYSGVLHHLPHRADRLKALREGVRILRPGGAMFSFDPSYHSPSMRLYRDRRSPFYCAAGKTPDEILLKRDELGGELTEAGFVDVTVRGVSGIEYAYVEGRSAAAVAAYNLYERLMRGSPFENGWGTFLVATGKKAAAA